MCNRMTIREYRVKDAKKIGGRKGHTIIVMGEVSEDEVTLICVKCQTKAVMAPAADLPQFIFSTCLTKPQEVKSKSVIIQFQSLSA